LWAWNFTSTSILCGGYRCGNALICSIPGEMRIPRRHHLFETDALHTLWRVPAWLTDGSIDVSTTEDPDDRDLRRRLLARRLISHQARTQTVTYFTDCSRNQLETLRRRWGVATNERHRGPSPTSFAEFFRNARTLQAATAAAILFNLLDTRRRPGHHPSPGTTKLATGEQICYVFEALQACFPHVELEFEHMVLLATGLARGEAIRLGHCTQCGTAILVDNFASRQTACRHCSRDVSACDASHLRLR
jgi:hypothetical protein